MPTSVGPNTFGEENLVFAFDTGDTVNSYKGMPIHNVIRPLDEWKTSNRINIEEVSGSHWDSPVPGARMWKCYYSSSIAVNSLTRDQNGSSYNPLLLSGSFGKSMYVYSMWVRGFTTNPTNSSINIDMHDRNNLSTTLNDTTWKRLTTVNADHNPAYPTYFFHDLYIAPTNSTKVDFLITGLMLARYSGSSYQDLTPMTATNIQWLPEGSLREMDESLVDLTGNTTLNLTNVSFDSNAQIDFDGTDDVLSLGGTGDLNFGVTSSFSIETVFKINSIPSSGNTSGIVCKTHCVGIDFYFPQSGTKLRAGTRNSTDGQQSHDSNQNLSTGEYYHAVFTYTPNQTSGIKIYIDGILDKTGNNTGHSEFADPTKAFEIAQGALGGTDVNSDITVPLVKMYNRVLTASEIKSNFNAIKGRFNIQ